MLLYSAQFGTKVNRIDHLLVAKYRIYTDAKTDRLTTKVVVDTSTGQLSDLTGVGVIGFAKANTDPGALVANLHKSLYAISVGVIIVVARIVNELYFSIVAVIGIAWRLQDC